MNIMTIEEEAIAAFRAMDDAHQVELLKLLKRTAERSPRRRKANLVLVVSRTRGDDLLADGGSIKDCLAPNRR